MSYEPRHDRNRELRNRELPKSLQRMLMMVGQDISAITTNGKTTNGILDSFCLRPALAYVVIETTESIEVINFSNIISLRLFKDKQTET